MTSTPLQGAHPKAQIGLYAIILASIAWGTTGIAASFAPDVGPIAIGAAAMGIGGILQACYAQAAIRQEIGLLRAQSRLLILGALCVMIYPLAFYASMRFAGVAIGTVISIASAPVFAALLERLFEKRPLSRRWLISASLSILGVIMITFSHKPSASAANIHWGIALGLLAGLTYAGYSWTARAMMMRGNSAKAAMGGTFGIGGLLLMPLLAASGGAFLDSWSNAAIGAYMALGPMFLGYLAFGFGLARVNASTATTITLIEPVIAALLAVVILSETLSLWGWVGIGFVSLGLMVLTLRFKP